MKFEEMTFLKRIAAFFRSMPSAPDAERGKPATKRTGDWGEDVAADWLRKQGYRILGRNVRPDRRDELDIIAGKGDWLAFVEVKTRKSAGFARPFTAVDRRKKHALNRAAAAYLRQVGYPSLLYRFDVIEVVGQPGGAEPRVNHIENAFPFERRFCFPVFPENPAVEAPEPPQCPLCGKPMVRRTANKGSGAGRDFWGCSGFPDCRGTRRV